MSAIPAIATNEDDNYRELARLSLEKTDGTVLDATDWLTNYVLNDRALIDRNLPEIVRTWASKWVRSILKERRPLGKDFSSGHGNVVSLPTANAFNTANVFNAAVEANYQRFMETSIWGGKKMSECTADDLYESADSFDKQARTMSRTAAWQSAVAAALEKNRSSETDRVRDCLSEATLSQLWEETSGN